jgi:hypothetical protein
VAGVGIEPKVLIVSAPGVTIKLIVLSQIKNILANKLNYSELFYKNSVKENYQKNVYN